ncbi:MAG: DegT/DnrJ/EryC1/StrS aminotransferase family protein [Dehalococcoidales bacterium]|nr:DegT/DnrJ/EryC1/StrS aminotransferase family protein [Dehalococcoidales bacterium]
MGIPSAKPFFSEEDIESISREIPSILRSGRLILGPYTRRFETLFQEYCGVKRAVAVSSCTSALEITLRYYDVVGKEIIVPTNTFIATSNAVLYAGGQTVLADIKPDTLCLDPEDLRQRITPLTKGVIVVHIAGLPCPDINEIQTICKERGLFLIEDVAHAHGATINGKKTGSLGHAGCFSFYPTKVMTTGTGGMITTDDDNLADYAVSLRHHGVGNGLTHIINLGNDWLMDEVTALLGLYQLKALESNLAKRNAIARRYSEALAGTEGVRLFYVPSNIRHSYYKYATFLSPFIDRLKLTERMKEEYDIELGSIYDPPCHLQPVYQRLFGYCFGMYARADETLKHICCLPMFPQITPEEIDYVIKSFKSVLQESKREKITV